MSSIEVTHEQLATLPPERLEAVQGLLTGWLAESEPEVLPISAEIAQTAVNDWLLRVLPDRFTALEPRLIAGGDIWSVPVGLAYPHIGVVGQVGEVLVSAFSRGIISSTRPEVMKSAGAACYREQENAINAAFLSAGNA
ncbi:MAG: hypothetical protein WBB01_15920 [Phormidesmis sp.]